MGKKDDHNFIALLIKHGRLNEATGDLRFEGMYASVQICFQYNGGVIGVPHSHVVWLLKHGRWPRDGYQIDHLDDDPMNNAPDNLSEVTHAENQFKRRGRIVSRVYGTGKYGYGINLHHDKNRDGRFYVTRYLSRGHHGASKTVRKGLGGYDTLHDAETAIAKYIAEIKEHGNDYLPNVPQNKKKESIALMAAAKHMRMMRAHGMTFDKIGAALGFSTAAVHARTKDVTIGNPDEITGIDFRRGSYRVRISIQDKETYIGQFETIKEAIAAHKDAILKHYEAAG